MNDFIESLSYHGAPAPVTAPRGLDPVRFIMRSFDEVPFTAFRPAPAGSGKFRRRLGRRARKPLSVQTCPLD